MTARDRLTILDALVVALERRTEVLAVIAESASAEVAGVRIAELLGVSRTAAVAVLDLQARRFARREAQRIVDERDRLRHELER